MEKLISIVIPSYNSASFLPETVPTFVNITESVRHMVEVIIVNDGSTDNTLEVANELATQYPDIVRVIDKENGGHGSTINAGIKNALGKYFKIVDGDDYVDSAEFERLILFLQNSDVDQVITPFVKDYFNEEKKEIIDFENVESGKEYTYDEFLSLVGRIPDMHAVVNRTELLRENNIQLSEHCFYVDMQYNVFPMHLINKVAYFDTPIYQYQLGDENQSVSLRSYFKNTKMHQHVIDSLINYQAANSDKLSNIQIQLLNKLISALISIQINIFLYDSNISKSQRQYEDYMEKIKNKHLFSYNNPDGKKAKILKQFPFMYFLMAKLYQIQTKS